jgi:hypothetical protein
VGRTSFSAPAFMSFGFHMFAVVPSFFCICTTAAVFFCLFYSNCMYLYYFSLLHINNFISVGEPHNSAEARRRRRDIRQGKRPVEDSPSKKFVPLPSAGPILLLFFFLSCLNFPLSTYGHTSLFSYAFNSMRVFSYRHPTRLSYTTVFTI